jgi:hypothetical protein
MSTSTLVVGKWYCVRANKPHSIVGGPFDTEAEATASMAQPSSSATATTSDTVNVMVAKTAGWGC